MFKDTFFKLFAVVIDQLAGEDHKAFSLLTAKCLISGIHKLRKLCRVAGRGPVLGAAGRVIADAGLCGVAGNETQIRIFCAFHVSLIVAVRV